MLSRRDHDLENQQRESQLDLVMDKMRQDSNETNLAKNLKKVSSEAKHSKIVGSEAQHSKMVSSEAKHSKMVGSKVENLKKIPSEPTHFQDGRL